MKNFESSYSVYHKKLAYNKKLSIILFLLKCVDNETHSRKNALKKFNPWMQICYMQIKN